LIDENAYDVFVRFGITQDIGIIDSRRGYACLGAAAGECLRPSPY